MARNREKSTLIRKFMCESLYMYCMVSEHEGIRYNDYNNVNFFCNNEFVNNVNL